MRRGKGLKASGDTVKAGYREEIRKTLLEEIGRRLVLDDGHRVMVAGSEIPCDMPVGVVLKVRGTVIRNQLDMCVFIMKRRTWHACCGADGRSSPLRTFSMSSSVTALEGVSYSMHPHRTMKSVNLCQSVRSKDFEWGSYPGLLVFRSLASLPSTSSCAPLAATRPRRPAPAPSLPSALWLVPA